MAWGFVRIAIFSVSFLIGLMFLGSGGSFAQSQTKQQVQVSRENIQLKCIDNRLVLIHRPSRLVAPTIRSVGM
jgi:hypothetical protein